MNGSSALAILLVVEPESDGFCLKQLRLGSCGGNHKARSGLEFYILHLELDGSGAHFLGCHRVFADS
jgi:hypothetical protein